MCVCVCESVGWRVCEEETNNPPVIKKQMIPPHLRPKSPGGDK